MTRFANRILAMTAALALATAPAMAANSDSFGPNMSLGAGAKIGGKTVLPIDGTTAMTGPLGIFQGSNWTANGYPRITFGSTTLTTGDSYTSPDAVMIGGTADMASGHLYIRGYPYGPLDLGTNLSVVMSDRPLAGTRAGVGPNGIGQEVSYADLDVVNIYNQAGSTPARFVVSSAYADQVDGQKHTVTYAANKATFSPALPASEVALLRTNMRVVTNSTGSTNNTLPANGGVLHNTYVGQITSWDPGGASITVDGWVVLGSGNTSTTQVPSATYDTVMTNYGAAALFVGVNTKAFARNTVCSLVPLGQAPTDSNNPKGNVGSQTTACEGDETDLFDYNTIDYQYTFHGSTVQYTPLGTVPVNGSVAAHTVQPASNSWAYHGGGPLPNIFVADELSTSNSFSSNAAVLTGNAGPASGSAVGTRAVSFETDKYANGTNNFRLTSWLQKETTASGGYGTHSWHLGLLVDGTKGNAGTGTQEASLVFDGANLPGGIGLCTNSQGQDASQCSLAVYGIDGHVYVPYKLVVGTGVDVTGVSTFRGGINSTLGLAVGSNPLVQSASPTIAGGFGTSPSIIAANGPASFSVNVGTGGAAGSGNIGLPAAANGWTCTATDITTADGNHVATKQFGAGTTTSIQLININSSGGVVAWAANDILRVSCLSY